MEEKTIILNLSSELIDKIDSINPIGDRSAFISNLLEDQIKSSYRNGLDETTELPAKMSENENLLGVTGKINLLNSNGISLGIFDIDTLEGFENLAKKIQEISKDPAVQIRAKSFF